MESNIYHTLNFTYSDNSSLLFNDIVMTPAPTSSSRCSDTTWHLYLKLVCLPLFVIIGLVGNFLAFFVMCSRSYKHKSYSYYLRVLAVTDSLTLVLTAVTWTNDMSYDLGGNGFLQAHNDVTCKLTEFIRHSVYVTSSWMVLCFTFDR